MCVFRFYRYVQHRAVRLLEGVEVVLRHGDVARSKGLHLGVVLHGLSKNTRLHIAHALARHGPSWDAEGLVVRTYELLLAGRGADSAVGEVQRLLGHALHELHGLRGEGKAVGERLPARSASRVCTCSRRGRVRDRRASQNMRRGLVVPEPAITVTDLPASGSCASALATSESILRKAGRTRVVLEMCKKEFTFDSRGAGRSADPRASMCHGKRIQRCVRYTTLIVAGRQ